MLLRTHREDPIERKSILLWSRTNSGGAHLHRLKVAIKADADLASFTGFDRVWWSKSKK